MPVFQFNSSQNSLNLFGNNRGIIPRVGINFGNSRLARSIGSFFGKEGERKGHPGSSGQVVGQGVRNLGNLFQGRLFGTDSIDAISEKRWEYESGSDLKHPAGFTPPYKFLNTKDGSRPKTWRPFSKYGINIETEITRGQQPMAFRPESFENNYLLTIPKSLEFRKDILQKRDPRTEKFSFGLNDNLKIFDINHRYKQISDNDFVTHTGLQTGENISLASFTKRITENEDPTMLGFDIEIDEVTSPLFNGAIEDFINNFGNESPTESITEISSRREIWREFIDQFKKFFRTNADFAQSTGVVKSHYITKISGLDKFNLVKSDESGNEGVKLFTNFPTEKITLDINEDVEQNISYLSYLYNMLSRSRIEGRRIIPQNLLRFNCRIIITEVRNFNRVVKEAFKAPEIDNKYKVISDLISKKEYNLYECEFSFNPLTHGSSVDLGREASLVSSYTISFNYKFVSSEFHKFNFDPGKEPYFTKKRYNDEFFNPKELTSLDTGRAIIQSEDPLNRAIGATATRSLSNLSSISFLDQVQNPIVVDRYPKNGYPFTERDQSSLGKNSLGDLVRGYVGGLVRNLVGNVLRAGADAINREVSARFNLVNKAINERLNRAGLSVSLNTIQNPRNIYNPGNRLRNELSNAIRGFVGRSTGRFFSRPVNTSEANLGFLSQRGGGPFRSSSIYRPVANRQINRLRASNIRSPRNIYVRRRIASFLGNSTIRQVPASRSSASTNPPPRVSPFVLGVSPTSINSQRGSI